MYIKKAHVAGLMYVGQIVSQGSCLTYNELVEKFGQCMTWLEYAIICGYLKRHYLTDTIENCQSLTLEMVKTMSKKVSGITKWLLEKEHPTILRKYWSHYQNNVNSEENLI